MSAIGTVISIILLHDKDELRSNVRSEQYSVGRIPLPKMRKTKMNSDVLTHYLQWNIGISFTEKKEGKDKMERRENVLS